MKKTRPFSAFALVTMGILLITIVSCKKPERNTDLIPRDANAVVVIDMESLIRKGRLYNSTSFNYVTLNKDLARRTELLGLLDRISKRPFSLGIDFTSDFALFVTVREYEKEQMDEFGIAPVDDPGAAYRQYVHLAQYEEDEFDDFDYYGDPEPEDDWDDYYDESGSDNWDSYNYYDEYEGEGALDDYEYYDDSDGEVWEEGTDDVFADDDYSIWGDEDLYKKTNEVVYIGMTANISSKRKFADFIENELEAIMNEGKEGEKYSFSIEDKDDYMICLVSNSIAIAWDRKKALLLQIPCYESKELLQNMVMELFIGEKDWKRLVNKPTFRRYYRHNKDINVYLSSAFTEDKDAVQACIDRFDLGPLNFGIAQLLDMMSSFQITSNHMFGYLEFEKDAVSWRMRLRPNKKAQRDAYEKYDIWDQDFNAANLKLFPRENIMAAGLTFNPSELFEMIKDAGGKSFNTNAEVFERDLDLSVDEILNSLDGSMVVSLMDIKQVSRERVYPARIYNPKKKMTLPPGSKDTIWEGGYETVTETERWEEMTPIWAVAIGLKNVEPLQKFIAGNLNEEDGIYSLLNVFFCSFGNSACYISNNKESLRMLQSGNFEGDLDKTPLKEGLRKNAIYGYANLDLKKIFRKLGEDFEYDNIDNIVRSVEVKMIDEYTLEFTINLKEENNNSLYTLLREADRQYRKEADGF